MTKIAIIEDDPIINQMYRLKFEAEGFNAQVAENGKVGVELVKNFQPDIILLDLMMPEMDGVDTLDHIRKNEAAIKKPHTPVIILTNLGEEEAPKKLLQLDIHSYIVKAAMTPREVVDAVKTTLNIK